MKDEEIIEKKEKIDYAGELEKIRKQFLETTEYEEASVLHRREMFRNYLRAIGNVEWNNQADKESDDDKKEQEAKERNSRLNVLFEKQEYISYENNIILSSVKKDKLMEYPFLEFVNKYSAPGYTIGSTAFGISIDTDTQNVSEFIIKTGEIPGLRRLDQFDKKEIEEMPEAHEGVLENQEGEITEADVVLNTIFMKKMGNDDDSEDEIDANITKKEIDDANITKKEIDDANITKKETGDANNSKKKIDDANNSEDEIDDEYDDENEELNESGEENENAPKENISAITEGYEKALGRFNEKRASFFKEESPEHERLRLAAENMLKKRKRVKYEENGTISATLRKLRYEEKENMAIDWLRSIHEMRDAANAYLKEKGSFTLTPAGRERKRGAEELKQIAKAEMSAWKKSVKKAWSLKDTKEDEVELENLYSSIYAATRKAMEKEAKTKAKNIFEKNKNCESAKDLPSEDYKQLRDAIYTLMAAQFLKSYLIGSENKEADRNIFKILKKCKRSDRVNQAVSQYLKQKTLGEIRQNIDDKEVMNELSEIYYNKEGRNISVDLRLEDKNKAPKKFEKPKGF